MKSIKTALAGLLCACLCLVSCNNDKNLGKHSLLECIKQIQEIVFLPEYDDGKAYINIAGDTINFDVTLQIKPSEYAEKIVEAYNLGETDFLFADVLSVEPTKAAQIPVTLPLSNLSFLSSGIIEASFDISAIDIDALVNGTQSYMCCFYVQYKDATISSTYVAINTKIDLEGIIPNNEIWYTSSNRQVITPYQTNVFGANIVSNDYFNGIGKIKFDKDVTSIGSAAFSSCSKLTSIKIPNSVTEIGGGAFNQCTSLTSINMPNSVTSIGNHAFVYCTSLTSIELSTSLTSIDTGAFENCTSLTSIEIPDSVMSIGRSAFVFCYNLASVTIGNSVTSIGYEAFSSTKLTSIKIPTSVTSIEAVAFALSNLTTVYCEPTTPPTLGGYCFNNNTSSIPTIYVPKSSVNKYKAAPDWSEYVSYIEGYDF